jgi:AraC-like DNA-binding protein
MPALLKYEAHTTPVCALLKGTKGPLCGRCIENKARLVAKRVDAPFFSSCYAGVEEFVIPVHADGVRVLMLNVSGYRDALEKSQAKRASTSAIMGKEFDLAYDALNPNVPTMDWILGAITPLTRLIYALYKECVLRTPDVSDDVYVKILAYLHEHIAEDCTVASVADALSYSDSYVRHVFRAKSGTSIGRYLIDLRMTRARELIETTNLSVAGVAAASGFDDPNYFSSAFKKHFGCSPLSLKKAVN